MKRKILVLATVALLVISSLLLISCNNNTVENKLSYGKKYIYDGHLSKSPEESNYFVFNSDGTGAYHYYYEFNDFIEAYTINFQYVIDDDVVYCFYDSFEYDDAHNSPANLFGPGDNSTWSAVLNFTDKFLYGIDIDTSHFYVTEEFSAKTIPNFGK